VEGGAPDGNAAARRSEGDSLSGAAFRGVFYTRSTKALREALIEIERPPHPDQDRAGFTCCEALVGSSVQPGSVCVLENHRMRIVETTLAPGGGSGMQRCERNAAVSVVQPGKVKVVETGAPAQSRSRKRRAMPRTSVGSRAGLNATW